MADFVVALLVFCVVSMVQGQTTRDDSLENRVALLERRGVEQDRLIVSLLERLDSQDAQILTQTRNMEIQQRILDSQDAQIQAQTRTLEIQQRRLDSQETQLQQQSRTLEQQLQLLENHSGQSEKLRSVVRRQGVRITNQERALKNLRSRIDLKSSPESSMKDGNIPTASGNPTYNTHTQVRSSTAEGTKWMNQHIESKRSASIVAGDVHAKRLVMAPEGPVAFHAVIDKREISNIGINQNIVFDVVLENLGGGYNTQHGVFSAPTNGVYIFSVTIMSATDAHPDFNAALKKDGMVLAGVSGHGDNNRQEQASVSIVTHLEQGNQVWVSLESFTDDSIYGLRYTSFMGCLVYQS